MLAIWARRADRKDMSKLGTIVMDSNDPLDKYLYELQVNTGSRKEAGTKSNVWRIIVYFYDYILHYIIMILC